MSGIGPTRTSGTADVASALVCSERLVAKRRNAHARNCRVANANSAARGSYARQSTPGKAGAGVAGADLFLSLVLYPTFSWDEAAYHLEGDPEGRTFAEILVDVIATEVVEPWGGGKWHLETFRSVSPEPEDWNGEM